MKSLILIFLVSIPLFSQFPASINGVANQSFSLNSPLPVTQGGTGTTTPTLTASTGIAITGSWPNQIISVNLNNLQNLLASAYNFQLMPLVNLTANISNTITLSPAPMGVDGSVSYYNVYIHDPVAGSEPVRITGGTCTALGTVNPCTVTFTPLINHTSSNWTIQSDGGGIREADNTGIAYGGAYIVLNNTTWNIHSTLYISSNNTLIGQAQSAQIVVPNGEFQGTNFAWIFVANTSLAVIAAKPSASYVGFRNFTVNVNASTQTAVSLSTGCEDILLYQSSHSVVSNVIFTGHYPGKSVGTNVAIIDALSGGGPGLAGVAIDNVIEYNSFHGDGTCATISGAPYGYGWVFVRGENNIVRGNTGDLACDAGYTANMGGKGNIFTENVAIANPADLGTHVAYEAEDSPRNIFSKNIVKGQFAVGFNIFYTSVEPADLQNNQVINNYINGANQGIRAIGCSTTSCGGTFSGPFVNSGLTITGNIIEGCTASGQGEAVILISGAVVGVVISNNIIRNNPTTQSEAIGILAQDSISSYPANIIVSNNYIDHTGSTFNSNGNDGILIMNGAGSTMPTNITITGNIVTDTASTKVQRYGIVIYDLGGVSTGMTGYIVTSNNFTGNVTGRFFITGSTLPSGSYYDPNSNI